MASPTSRNLYLVGFMGTGKSTVGRLLAEALDRPFTDIDDEIERRTGHTIPAIFGREGEAGFRRHETEALFALRDRGDLVVSCGGGIVTTPDNLDALLAEPGVFCLTATPDTIWARVRHDTHRPLLSGPDPQSAIRDLLATRTPLYAQFTHQIPTDDRAPADVAADILHHLHHP